MKPNIDQITPEEYRTAVNRLVALARHDTSGSRAAAQVLLSLYNGYNWHVDLIDLGLLDAGYFRAALIAIRGRLTLHDEPHEMIENGAQIFSELEEQWAHLHRSRRYVDD